MVPSWLNIKTGLSFKQANAHPQSQECMLALVAMSCQLEQTWRKTFRVSFPEEYVQSQRSRCRPAKVTSLCNKPPNLVSQQASQIARTASLSKINKERYQFLCLCVIMVWVLVQSFPVSFCMCSSITCQPTFRFPSLFSCHFLLQHAIH